MRIKVAEYEDSILDPGRSIIVDTARRGHVQFSVGCIDSKFAMRIADPNEVRAIIHQLTEWHKRRAAGEAVGKEKSFDDQLLDDQLRGLAASTPSSS